MPSAGTSPPGSGRGALSLWLDALGKSSAPLAVRVGTVSPSATPAPAHAWCYACRGLRPFRLPLPRLDVRRIPLTRTLDGNQVGEQVVTLREGHCGTCGAAICRVGGGRSAEPEPPTTEGPTRDDGTDDLFAAAPKDDPE
jgi:hypothetical protein